MFKTLAALGINKNFGYLRFLVHPRVFVIFHEIFPVARTYQVLAADIKSFNISVLMSLEMMLKVMFLAIF